MLLLHSFIGVLGAFASLTYATTQRPEASSALPEVASLPPAAAGSELPASLRPSRLPPKVVELPEYFKIGIEPEPKPKILPKRIEASKSHPLVIIGALGPQQLLMPEPAVRVQISSENSKFDVNRKDIGESGEVVDVASLR